MLADGTRLLTTTIGVNLLNVFDAANLHGRQLMVPVGRRSAWRLDGKTALVSNHGDGTISVVDVATGTVKSSSPRAPESKRSRITDTGSR
jgi:DNA-binding beta-propeller fold protein YncE